MCGSYNNRQQRRKARRRASQNKPAMYAASDRYFSLLKTAMMARLRRIVFARALEMGYAVDDE